MGRGREEEEPSEASCGEGSRHRATTEPEEENLEEIWKTHLLRVQGQHLLFPDTSTIQLSRNPAPPNLSPRAQGPRGLRAALPGTCCRAVLSEGVASCAAYNPLHGAVKRKPCFSNALQPFSLELPVSEIRLLSCSQAHCPDRKGSQETENCTGDSLGSGTHGHHIVPTGTRK